MELLLKDSVSCGYALRLYEYNENLRQLRGELRESLEAAVKDDGVEKTWCL
jgi:hypothetical protein